MVLKRPKAGSKKSPQKKYVPLRQPSPRFFFFAAFPNFVFLGRSANRFRLADLGGVEPLRKLIRQKLALGSALVWIGLRLGRKAQLLLRLASAAA